MSLAARRPARASRLGSPDTALASACSACVSSLLGADDRWGRLVRCLSACHRKPCARLSIGPPLLDPAGALARPAASSSTEAHRSGPSTLLWWRLTTWPDASVSCTLTTGALAHCNVQTPCTTSNGRNSPLSNFSSAQSSSISSSVAPLPSPAQSTPPQTTMRALPRQVVEGMRHAGTASGMAAAERLGS